MDPCIIAYMLLTYAIKAIIFVWIFEWIQTKIINNFLIMILVFVIIFAGLDYILVSALPASGWKKNLREHVRVPENMQCVLAIDYIIKAGLFYYVYEPVNGVSYYNSSSTIIKFIIIFAIMFCTDIVVSFGLEKAAGREYAEQFCGMCSM